MTRLLLLFLLLFQISVSQAGLVVIVNQNNAISELSRSEVIDLYMGRHTNFADNTPCSPLDQPIHSELRTLFYQQLVNKSVAEVNAYWARLLFTGRATPPRPMENNERILQFVQDNKNALAYLDSQHINDSVKVVYRFEHP